MYVLNFFIGAFKSAGSLLISICKKEERFPTDEEEPLVSREERLSFITTHQFENQANLTAEYTSWWETTDAVRQCLLYLLAYFAVAVIGYSFLFEKWPIADSIYFAVVIFTTVGMYISRSAKQIKCAWISIFFLRMSSLFLRQ